MLRSLSSSSCLLEDNHQSLLRPLNHKKMKQQNVCPQSPDFSFDDGLFCDEQGNDLDFGCGFGWLDPQDQISKQKHHLYSHFEHDLSWGVDELSSLLSKETNTSLREGDLVCDSVLMRLREESVHWIIRASTLFGFVAMTTVSAVNYFDRFLLSPKFQRDKPWMNQLAAVASLSIASKVEETEAPLLSDLQVEGSKFVFDSKTIMKMELLVLFSLQWKMHPATPLAFFDYIMRRLGLVTHHLHSEFVLRCERIVLAVIHDSRFLGYLPSVFATATMFLVIKEIDPDNAMDFWNRLKGFLEINEEKIDECSKFILEASHNHETSHSLTQNRNYHSNPGSPNCVIDSYFSSDNSNDSWATGSSVSPSPEPALKKFRAQEQQMRVTRVSISAHSYTH